MSRADSCLVTVQEVDSISSTTVEVASADPGILFDFFLPLLLRHDVKSHPCRYCPRHYILVAHGNEIITKAARRCCKGERAVTKCARGPRVAAKSSRTQVLCGEVTMAPEILYSW